MIKSISLRGCYDPQRKKADAATLNKPITELTELGSKFRIVMDQDSRDRALGITDVCSACIGVI